MQRAATDNHLNLLCDIGELTALLAGSENLETFLDRIVDMVARHVRAAVCSIYIFDRQAQRLQLKATHGLARDSVDRISLRLGEGLVGMALAHGRPVRERVASSNPHFKRFEGSNEELYEAFLAMPILRGIERIGVLVVQRPVDQGFDDNDVMALRAAASQLASAIENARTLMALRSHRQPAPEEGPVTDLDVVRGRVAAKGFAIGPALVLDQDKSFRKLRPMVFERQLKLKDFEQAVAKTEAELEALQGRVGEGLNDIAALIFDAHIMMLKDSEFSGAMRQRIKNGANPPEAVLAVAGEFVDLLSVSENAYMREKTKDVEDLALRLLGHLIGNKFEATTPARAHIVIAKELYPSEILKLSTEDVAGIVLVSGGVTSHLSILADSLQIPMIIAETPQLVRIPNGVSLMLDAEAGTLYVNPSRALIKRYHDRATTAENLAALKASMRPETRTADGTRVRLMANINLLHDMELANELSAEGVGLYRSEFPFMVRASFPTEEEQLAVYRNLLLAANGKDVTIRTLDVGGDKTLAYYDNAREENPALGMRSIRFSLQHPEILHQQLRAILRAGGEVDSRLRVMFPMISSVDEFIQARQAVYDCQTALIEQGLPSCEPEIGLMVEIPSAVEVIEDLANEADFFCIGTNDFIQFMLAVDRTNEKVAAYYVPHHPAVLRALRRVVSAATSLHKDVSICGEMAHEPRYIPFFLGIGVRNLSLAARYLPSVQQAVTAWTVKNAEAHAAALLSHATLGGVTSELQH